MAEYLLETKDIVKSFGGVRALKGVSINLLPNEILAIVGENGAGKSTLMKVLSGSYAADSYSGEIFLSGEKQSFMTPSDSQRCGIEMIYQELSVHLDASIAENIFLGRLPSKGGVINWAKINKEAEPYLRMIGLDAKPGTVLRDLSTSQQQMVVIARALSRNPKILILDEPTSALTETEVDALFERLLQLKEAGVSCIYITHKMNEVMKISDRVTIFRDGMYINTHESKHVSMETIIEEMVARKMGAVYPKKAPAKDRVVLEVADFVVEHPQNSRKNIVNHVSFQVKEGEILGIVGLVGAGRSELMSGIVGAMEKKNGSVKVEGKTLRIKSPQHALRAGIAYLSEERKINGYIPAFDVAMNISLASMEQVSKGGIIVGHLEKKKTAQYIQYLRIKVNSAKDNILTLSGGNQQKVILAKWLMAQPKVLLLDEPTRGVDVGAKTQIYEIMVKLAAQGMAIVMVSSEFPELVGVCDRHIVLANGEIKAELSREDADEVKFLSIASRI